MRRGDPRDPLLLQVLPVRGELQSYPNFVHDPVGDARATPIPGVIHKYHGRVLLITTGACAVHCRYCFRRHYPYSDSHAANENWNDALEYLRTNADVREVILSGGDPLSLSDERLARLVIGLESIPHLKILRIHTRQPIVLPERVDDSLLSWMKKIRMKTVMVLHANHANEIDASVIEAIAALKTANITLLNQSVLLKNINDDVDTLTQLSWRLFENGVQPYYLHLLDRVAGAGHFEVSEDQATRIYRNLAGKLPGYCVPRLVREQAGAPFKLPISVNNG
jgi:EF-P beta-lysylation protein EpmB